MAKTVEELTAKVVELEGTIDEQVKEVADLIVAVDALLEKLTVSQDLQPLYDKVVAMKEKLLIDNPNVQETLDKVNPPEPPAEPVA